MDLRGIEWEVVDSIYLAQVKVKMAGSREHGNEPSGSLKDEFLD
jgi:hypothetical protein